MKSLLVYSSFITVVIMLVCCNTTTKPVGAFKPGSSLENSPGPPAGGSENFFASRWVLAEAEGQPVTSSGNNREAHLLFYPGQVNRVSGFTGCNTLNGSFELSGENKIMFSPVATTKMMCPPGNDTETRLLSAMQKANNYYFSADHLMLLNEKLLVAKLKAVTPASSKWTGTWELNYITGKRIAFDGLYPDKKPHISFNFINNEASGHTSCNAFSTAFKVEENKISISPPRAMTMIACGTEGEKSFLQMLEKVNGYEFSNEDTLILKLNKVTVLRFNKK